MDLGVVRMAGRALTAVTIATALLAAAATVGILIPADWWAGLVIALALSSAFLLTLRFYVAAVTALGSRSLLAS